MATKKKTETTKKSREISVYEALTERKIQQKKLDNIEVNVSAALIDNPIIVAAALPNSDEDALKRAENTTKSTWDKIQAVMRNIDELTSKINASNAETKITINDVEMTKAEAIYRYNHIQQRINLYTDLLEHVTNRVSDVETHNAKLYANTSVLEKTITEAIGEQGERSYEEWIKAREDYKNSLIDNKKYVLVDPYDLKTALPELIQELENYKEKFNLEMNKSNLTTMITVVIED